MEGELKKISVKCVCLMADSSRRATRWRKAARYLGFRVSAQACYSLANLIIYFELWQRKEENRCASGAKTLEIFRKTLEIFRQTSEFWGVMAEKTLHRWGSGGKIGGKVCPLWCSLRLHLVQPSPPSGAAFTPLWCNLSAHLV